MYVFMRRIYDVSVYVYVVIHTTAVIVNCTVPIMYVCMNRELAERVGLSFLLQLRRYP